MTDQEIFDKVVRHLAKQGGPSLGPPSLGTCAYRSADGKSCAVGCLIKDEFYSVDLEGLPAGMPAVQRALDRSLSNEISSRTFSLLSRLQNVHDANWNTWYRVPDKLRIVAINYNLNPTVIDGCFGGKDE